MSILVKVLPAPRSYLRFDQVLIDHPGLSGFAKWVYSYVASRPPEWRIYAEEIAQHCTEGIGKVKKALAELQTAGLLLIELDRDDVRRIRGRVWTLFGMDKLSAALTVSRQARLNRSPKTRTVEIPTDGNAQLLILDSPDPALEPDPSPESPKPVQPRSEDVETKSDLKPKSKPGMGRLADAFAGGKATGPVRSLADLIARCQEHAQLPVHQARLDERTKAEKREQQMKHQNQIERAEAERKTYGKYLILEPAKAVETVCRDFLADWSASRDAEGLMALQGWLSKHNDVKRLVDAGHLAQKHGGKKRSTLSPFWSRQHDP